MNHSQAPDTASKAINLRRALASWATFEGFDACGVTHPSAIAQAGGHLLTFLAEGRHGDMAWLANNAERRAHPDALWPDRKSVV